MWDGWAGEVIGDTAERLGGRVLGRLGNSIGEMNGLRRESVAEQVSKEAEHTAN